MSDRLFAGAGDWALASDGVQWILLRCRTRRGSPFWNPVLFVRSTKDVLARCMREKGVGAATARSLLSGLPDAFDTWKTSLSASQPAGDALPRRLEARRVRETIAPAISPFATVTPTVNMVDGRFSEFGCYAPSAIAWVRSALVAREESSRMSAQRWDDGLDLPDFLRRDECNRASWMNAAATPAPTPGIVPNVVVVPCELFRIDAG